jgi:hypothetical protein
LKEEMIIGAKNAQVVVVKFLGFQKSHCFANKVHCCATFVIVKFITTNVLVVVIQIDAKQQQSTFNGGLM